ncbi:TetR/AcrR family transcriptional regulator [Tessaracoccus sp. G1721]
MQARGSYAKGVAKREEILTAALDSFVEKGYDRTSVREIARSVGLSQAGLLHYFSSKEELFLQVLSRRDKDSVTEDAVEGSHTVERLMQAVVRNTRQAGLVALFVAMSGESVHSSGEARQFFEERYRWLLEDIRVDVARMQEAGAVTAAMPAEAIASLLVAAVDGLQIQWLLNPDGVDMVARLHDLLGLLGAPGR